MWRALPLLALLACGSEYGTTPIPPEPPTLPDTATPPEVIRVSADQTWEQSYRLGQLDVLVYVDKSGSMSWAIYSDKIGDALVSMAEAIDPGGPWTMTVMSTTQGGSDVEGPYTSLVEAGRIRSAPRRLYGGFGEQGLGAVHRESGTPGTVHVVFTDEDDQSVPPAGFSATTSHPDLGGTFWAVDEWAAEWKALTDESLILVVALGDCGTPYASERYEEAAALTGAAIHDLCGDWAPSLADFEWPWDDPRTEYTLDEDPIPSTVRVYFDGLLQPSTAWTLSGRTITLADPPPVGTVIRITYDHWSLQ